MCFCFHPNKAKKQRRCSTVTLLYYISLQLAWCICLLTEYFGCSTVTAFAPNAVARQEKDKVHNLPALQLSSFQQQQQVLANRFSRPSLAGLNVRTVFTVSAKNNDRENENDDDDDDEWFPTDNLEVIQDEEEEDDDGDWTPDIVKAQIARENSRIYAERVRDDDMSNAAPQEGSKKGKTATASQEAEAATGTSATSSPYTEEEEAVIASMGGKKASPGTREPGYLGDSTLQEIATDYSVPVSYIADVLCMYVPTTWGIPPPPLSWSIMCLRCLLKPFKLHSSVFQYYFRWGVPVPIHLHDRLGDLVTGEQAFALLEAVNSLDISVLQDRYSNYSLLNLCYEWDAIDIQEAFEFAMKQGWSLPFGVQTCLRVEQEEELLRAFGQL